MPNSFSIGLIAEHYLKGVYAACFALHILEFVLLPPARYPDLFPVLNVLISTPIFVLTWLWSMKSLIEARWTVGGLGLGTRSRRPSMSDKGHSDHPPLKLVPISSLTLSCPPNRNCPPSLFRCQIFYAILPFFGHQDRAYRSASSCPTLLMM